MREKILKFGESSKSLNKYSFLCLFGIYITIDILIVVLILKYYSKLLFVSLFVVCLFVGFSAPSVYFLT